MRRVLNLVLWLILPLLAWGSGPLPAQNGSIGLGIGRPGFVLHVPPMRLALAPERPFTRWQLADLQLGLPLHTTHGFAHVPRIWPGRLKMALTARDSVTQSNLNIAPGFSKWVALNRSHEFRIGLGSAWEIKQGAFWFRRHWTVAFAQISTLHTNRREHFMAHATADYSGRTHQAPQATPRVNRNGKERRPLLKPDSPATQFLKQWSSQLGQSTYWMNWLKDQRPGLELGYRF